MSAVAAYRFFFLPRNFASAAIRRGSSEIALIAALRRLRRHSSVSGAHCNYNLLFNRRLMRLIYVFLSPSFSFFNYYSARFCFFISHFLFVCFALGVSRRPERTFPRNVPLPSARRRSCFAAVTSGYRRNRNLEGCIFSFLIGGADIWLDRESGACVCVRVRVYEVAHTYRASDRPVFIARLRPRGCRLAGPHAF